MLEIFKRNRFFNSLLLLPYTILVRVWLVFDGQSPVFNFKGILTDWVFSGLNPDGGLALLLSILIVYLQALMLNRLIIRNRITQELTLFPGLFYILLVSFFPEYNGLSAPLLANTFVILALDRLWSTHKDVGNASRIFTAGFWFSVAFLFYFGYIVLFLCGILGLSMLRTVKPREWLQFLIGFLAPLSIVGMLDYLMHSDISDIQQHFTEQIGFLDIDIPVGWPLYLQMTLFGALVILVVFNYASFTLKKNIHVQKKVNLMYMWLFLLFGILLLQSGIFYEEWTVLSLPLACFIAMFFVRSRQWLILEIIHFGILLSVLTLQIITLL
jgi:uncharacterized protein DUF6427